MSKPGELKENEIYLGQYLLARIAEHSSILFGVPG